MKVIMNMVLLFKVPYCLSYCYSYEDYPQNSGFIISRYILNAHVHWVYDDDVESEWTNFISQTICY